MDGWMDRLTSKKKINFRRTVHSCVHLGEEQSGGQRAYIIHSDVEFKPRACSLVYLEAPVCPEIIKHNHQAYRRPLSEHQRQEGSAKTSLSWFRVKAHSPGGNVV